MTEPELAELSLAIAQGRARYASGEPVADAPESCLATEDGGSAYGIRDGVPLLLPTLRIISTEDPARPATGGPRAAGSGAFDDRWEGLSLYWHNVQPPQRPSRQDIDVLQRLVAENVASAASAPPRALMLGLTPEIATMRWPQGTRLLALDSSPGMIRRVWPAREVAGGIAVLADWATMPVRDGAYDVAVGDGFLTSLPYPDGFLGVVAELRRVLKDDATFVMREFARPEEKETVDAIFRDLRGGRIVDFGILTWRLAMALHGDLEAGCRLGEVWDAWHDNVADPIEFKRSMGWPLDALDWLKPYHGTPARMTFPTLSEARGIFSRDFEQVECLFPDYPDGDRYPTAVFKPRPRGGGRRRT